METACYLFHKEAISRWNVRQREAWRLRKENPGTFLYYFTLTGYSSLEPMAPEERDSIIRTLDTLKLINKRNHLTKDDWGYISNNVARGQRTGRQCRDYIIQLGIDENVNLISHNIDDVEQQDGSMNESEYQKWTENESFIARGALNTSGARRIARAVENILKELRETKDKEDVKKYLNPPNLSLWPLEKSQSSRTDLSRSLCLTGETVTVVRERIKIKFSNKNLEFEDFNDVDQYYSDAEAENDTTIQFLVNERVHARWYGDNEFYPGKILQVNQDGTFDILYDDGDSEKQVLKKNLRKENFFDLDSGSVQSLSDEDSHQILASSSLPTDTPYQQPDEAAVSDSEFFVADDIDNDPDYNDHMCFKPPIIDGERGNSYLSTERRNMKRKSPLKRWNIIEDSSSDEGHGSDSDAKSSKNLTQNQPLRPGNVTQDFLSISSDDEKVEENGKTREISSQVPQDVLSVENNTTLERNMKRNKTNRRQRKKQKEHLSEEMEFTSHYSEYENVFMNDDENTNISMNQSISENQRAGDDLKSFFNGWDDEEKAVLPIAMRKKDYKEIMSMKESKCLSKLKKLLKQLPSKLEKAERLVEKIEKLKEPNKGLIFKVKQKIEAEIQQHNLELCRILMSRLEKSKKSKYSEVALISLDNSYSEYDKQASALIKRLRHIETLHNSSLDDYPVSEPKTAFTFTSREDEDDERSLSSESPLINKFGLGRSHRKRKRTSTASSQLESCASDDDLSAPSPDHSPTVSERAVRANNGILDIDDSNDAMHIEEEISSDDGELDPTPTGHFGGLTRLVSDYSKLVDSMLSQNRSSLPNKKRSVKNRGSICSVKGKGILLQNQLQAVLDDFASGGDAFFNEVYEDATRLHRNVQLSINKLEEEETKGRSYLGKYSEGTVKRKPATFKPRNQPTKQKAELASIDRLLERFAEQQKQNRMNYRKSYDNFDGSLVYDGSSEVEDVEMTDEGHQQVLSSLNRPMPHNQTKENVCFPRKRTESRHSLSNDRKQSEIMRSTKSNMTNSHVAKTLTVFENTNPIDANFCVERKDEIEDTHSSASKTGVDIELIAKLAAPRVRVRPLCHHTLSDIQFCGSDAVKNMRLWDPFSDDTTYGCFKVIPMEWRLNMEPRDVAKRCSLIFRKTFMIKLRKEFRYTDKSWTRRKVADVDWAEVNKCICQCLSLACMATKMCSLEVIEEFLSFVCDPTTGGYSFTDEKEISSLRTHIYFVLFRLLHNKSKNPIAPSSAHTRGDAIEPGNSGVDFGAKCGDRFGFANLLLHDLFLLFVDSEVNQRPWKRGLVYIRNNPNENAEDVTRNLTQSPVLSLWKNVMDTLDDIGGNGTKGGFWATLERLMDNVENIESLRRMLSNSSDRFRILHSENIGDEMSAKEKSLVIPECLEWSEICWDILFHALPLYSSFDAQGKWSQGNIYTENCSESLLSIVVLLMKKYTPLFQCKTHQDVNTWKTYITWFYRTKGENGDVALIRYCKLLIDRVGLLCRARAVQFPGKFIYQLWLGVQLVTSCTISVNGDQGMHESFAKLVADEFQLNLSVTQLNRLSSGLLNLLPQKKSVVNSDVQNQNKQAISLSSVRKQIWTYGSLRNSVALLLSLCGDASESQLRKISSRICMLVDIEKSDSQAHKILLEVAFRLIPKFQLARSKVSNLTGSGIEFWRSGLNSELSRVIAPGDLIVSIVLATANDYNRQANFLLLREEQRIAREKELVQEERKKLALGKAFRSLPYRNYKKRNRMVSSKLQDGRKQNNVSQSKNYFSQQELARISQEQFLRLELVEMTMLKFGECLNNGVIYDCGVNETQSLFGKWMCNELGLLPPLLNILFSIKAQRQIENDSLLVAALGLMSDVGVGLVKMSPWLVPLGSDFLKLGYPSRKHPMENCGPSLNHEGHNSIDDILASLDIEALVKEKNTEKRRLEMINNAQRIWRLHAQSLGNVSAHSLNHQGTEISRISQVFLQFYKMIILVVKNWWVISHGKLSNVSLKHIHLIERGTGLAAKFLGHVAALTNQQVSSTILSSFKLDRLTWLRPKPHKFRGGRIVPMRIHAESFLAYIKYGKDPIVYTNIPLHIWLNIWLVATLDHSTWEKESGAGKLYLEWTRRLGEYGLMNQVSDCQSKFRVDSSNLSIYLAESLLKTLLTVDADLLDRNQYGLRLKLFSGFCSEISRVWSDVKSQGKVLQSCRNLLNGLFAGGFDVIGQSLSDLVALQLSSLGLGAQFFVAKRELRKYSGFVFDVIKIGIESCAECMYIPGGSNSQNLFRQIINTCMVLQPRQLDIERGNISKPEKNTQGGAFDALLAASKTKHFPNVVPTLLVALHTIGDCVKEEKAIVLEQLALYVNHLATKESSCCETFSKDLNEFGVTSILLTGECNCICSPLMDSQGQGQLVVTAKHFAPMLEIAKQHKSAAIQSGAMKTVLELLKVAREGSLQFICAKTLFDFEESTTL